MSSGTCRRHWKRLGVVYGYGSFRGSDGKSHVGIDRMSLIESYREAALTARASSAILEVAAVEGPVAANLSGCSSPSPQGVISVEDAIPVTGDVVVPVLAVDRLGTQAVSTVRVRYGAERGGFSLARPRPYNGPGGLFWG